MGYGKYKLADKVRDLHEQLEEWVRKYSASLHSATLDRIIDELDKARKEFRRDSAHFRKAKK